MRTSSVLGLLAVSVSPTLAAAQGARTLDEGSFTITVNGQRAGREDFSITGTPSGRGTEFIAKATIVYGDRRLSPAMQADSTGVPMQYQIETRNASGTQDYWSGTIARGRVDARMRTARGEARKEYIVTEGALILDDEVFHQYYFVAARRGAGSIPVVIPRRNQQVTMRIATAGSEQLTIGNQQLQAQHLTLTEPSGDRRDLWVDAQGRVLKVAIPSRGLIAVRDDPPR
jgi:hypothetical protein